ncbi:MAG TPA: LuxR C-terminal-related transcriptional regulator [Rhabdochlamydiaceae bacterium]
MLNWEEIVQKYIVKHSDRIKKTTKPLVDHFGIAYFTYHRIDNEGKYTVLVDRPEWAERYVSSKIYLVDPYLRHPSVFESGISLWENHGSEEYRETVMKEAKEILDLDTSVTLIQKHNGCVEFFGFAGKKEDCALESLYLNHRHLLKSFIGHFKREMRPVLTQMEDEAGSLIDLKGLDFFRQEPMCADLPSETLLAYYKDLGMKWELAQIEKLTPRERQCLKLLTEDKSAKETAALLGLSPRTIESYFENIKNKLSCTYKHEVLHLARTLQEIGLL